MSPRVQAPLPGFASPESMVTGAEFSPCRRYRYTLFREWDPARPSLVVIGLNPSTATETEDDPTIRRCIGFARRDGFGAYVMLNLFAFRSTDPLGLLTVTDPVGPDNDRRIEGTCFGRRSGSVVAAWGSHARLGPLVTERAEAVVARLRVLGIALSCFGVNADGAPKHPLYLPKTAPVVPLGW